MTARTARRFPPPRRAFAFYAPLRVACKVKLKIPFEGNTMNAKIAVNARTDEGTAGRSVCESGTNPGSQLDVRRVLEIVDSIENAGSAVQS